MPAKPNLEKLLSPFQLRNVKLRNRMVKTAGAMSLASDDGFVTCANVGWYGALANGGIGLIIVEHGFVDYPMGVTGPWRIGISDDKFLPGITEIVRAIHQYGTPCFQQLGHGGPYQRWLLAPGQRAVAPSAVEERLCELSLAEIGVLVDKYAQAAQRAIRAGYDGIEIHGAAGYLVNAFLSRASNRRQDTYGCTDLESRARFLTDILKAIRQSIGEDYALGVRLNGAEYGLDDGITSVESQAFAQMAERAGADYICMQVKGYGAFELLGFPEQVLYPEPADALPRRLREPGALVPLGEAIKQAVKIPVIAAGRLDAVLGESILKNQQADLIGLNRRLFADPDYPLKVATGRLEDIAPCTGCLECGARHFAGQHLRCRINATLGREDELALTSATQRKKVVVVGGGPAGMEVARVAARRGHEVTLFEKERRLGGLLPLAALIKGFEVEDLPSIINYLERQIRQLGVHVRLGREMSARMVEEFKPDVAVIASGGVLMLPEIPGIHKPKVLSNVALHRTAQRYLRFMSPRALRWLSQFYLPIGKTVVIVGGSMQGCELAEFLVKRGRTVTLVDSSAQLGAGMHDIHKRRLLAWFTKKGVSILTQVKYEQITDIGLVITTKDGERQTVRADTIIPVMPLARNTALYEALKARIPEVHLIGDSNIPANILQAIDDGYQLGRAI